MKHRVLLVHDRYREPGGEDISFDAEIGLLGQHGHPVRQVVFDNTCIPDRRSPLESALLGLSTVWSWRAASEVRDAVREFRPDVVHFYNTFPLISPAAYYVVKSEGAAVVQSLSNYRLLCPSAIFYRDGRVCEDCLAKFIPWPAVLHACVRGSRAASAATTAMLAFHRGLRTWARQVDLYVAPTDLARQKFVQGGLPAEKIVIGSDFVPLDSGSGKWPRSYFLFASRFTPEKGVRTLLGAWGRLHVEVPLIILGDGPLAPEVTVAVGRLPCVRWLGWKSLTDLYRHMAEAIAVVFPSQWYEGLPRTIIESFATGTPVLASSLGATNVVVRDGETGLHFRPGDSGDLAARVEWAWTHLAQLAEMGQNARREYEENYTADHGYRRLLEIYALAIERARGAG